MAASGQTYPAIYLAGEIGTVRGYYGSTDGGTTWTQDQRQQPQLYYSGYVITGDPNRFGRVYIATKRRAESSTATALHNRTNDDIAAFKWPLIVFFIPHASAVGSGEHPATDPTCMDTIGIHPGS